MEPSRTGRESRSSPHGAAPARVRLPVALRDVVACFLMLAALSLVAAPSVAQTGGRGDAPVSERALRSALVDALSRPAPGTAPEDAVAALAFRRDAAVTAREREAFIANLAKQPAGAGALEPSIRSGQLMAEFDRLLQRYGYSPRNLGDVLAAHLVICWEIANEADSNDQPAGQRAVRRQLAGALASVPAIARMSDAEKQGQAERTAYLTMVAGSAYQELKRGGNPAQLADLQRNVRASTMRSGIDLDRLALTPGGLVAR